MRCVGFVEWDRYAQASYRAVHTMTDGQLAHVSSLVTIGASGRRCYTRAVREALDSKHLNGLWSATDIRDVKGHSLPQSDVWAFGAPCQDFSVAGRRAGLEGDRSSLVREVFRLLGEVGVKPRVLVYENVLGILSSNGGRDFGAIMLAMDALGYDVSWQLFNSKDFGVPQNRERVYTVGMLRDGKPTTVFMDGLFPLSDVRFDGRNLDPGRLGVANLRQIVEDGTSSVRWKNSGYLAHARIVTYDDTKTLVDAPDGFVSPYPATAPQAPRPRLVDVLEQDVPEGFYLSDVQTEKLIVQSSTDNRAKVKARFSFPDPCARRGTVPTMLEGMIDIPEGEARPPRGTGPYIVSRGHGYAGQSEHDLSPTVSSSAFADNNFVVEPSGVYTNATDGFQRGFLPGLSRSLRSEKIDAAVAIPVTVKDGALHIKDDGIANTIDANYFKGLDNHQARVGVMVRNNSVGTPALEACEGDNVSLQPTARGSVRKGCSGCVATRPDAVVVRSGFHDENAMEARVGDSVGLNDKMRGRVMQGVSKALTVTKNPGVVTYELRIRKLTPLECWRLQGFNDQDYRKAAAVVSHSQLYKQAGNAVTTTVAQAVGAAIAQRIHKEDSHGK